MEKVKSQNTPKGRECLITTGATAPFPELIKAGLDCLDTFRELGYTRITFQAGKALDYFHEIKPHDTRGLKIEAFDFTSDLSTHMRALKTFGTHKGHLLKEQGLVISHAGKANCLKGMTISVDICRCGNSSGCYPPWTSVDCGTEHKSFG